MCPGDRFDSEGPNLIGSLTDTERAVLKVGSFGDVASLFSAYTRAVLGSPIAHVRFRAGRIDAVWGVELGDRRRVVIKAFRRPVDVQAVAAAVEAKRWLGVAGFPCPVPLSGPDEVNGHLLIVETLLAGGAVPDGREPANRRLLAQGLATHIDLLRTRPDLRGPAGAGPAWCRYQGGPWPVPHDPIVNFRTTPAGYEWLDELARRCGDQICTWRMGTDVVVGHADWYAGNTTVSDGALVGTFDWELVADAESVIAGFAAACYAASATSGGGLSSPEEAIAFLSDYDAVRPVGFTAAEQRMAAGATDWILTFNARWALGLGQDGSDPTSPLARVKQRHHDYLGLRW